MAVIFAPLIGKALLKAPKAEADAKPSKLLALYSAFLRGAIRMKWLTIGLTLAAFVVALFLLRFVPQQFFPASDRPELTVDMTLRQNASIYATEAQAKRFEALLKADPDVDHFSTYVGRGAIRFILTLNVQLANPFFAQFVVVAKDLEARERLQVKLEKALAEQFPDVVARVSPLELGPPVGWPLQYRVTGPDMDEVRAHRARAGAGAGRRSARPARQFRLDGAGAAAARQREPGRGAPARRQLAGAGRRAQRRRHRYHGDAGARRHLPGQRGGARHRRRACLVPDASDRCRCRRRAGAWCR